MTKLLREKYKTWEGANKRARFENGIAPFEFKSGYKARLYYYVVANDPDSQGYRVERRPSRNGISNVLDITINTRGLT